MFSIAKNLSKTKKYINFNTIQRNYVTKKFDSQKLLSAIADLEHFNIKLKRFPTLVLLGPQSSGKSSVIQSLIGDYILPTDMKMSTRKPTHITTLKSSVTSYKIGSKEFNTAKEAASEINRLNKNDMVKQIDVIVNSPNVHNSIFVDLPGLFSISNDSTNNFKKVVKDMALDYASNKNLIPVLVHAAPSDPATNTAIKLISNVNRRNDALGILTKIDMVRDQKTEYLEKMLNGVEFKLGYGFVAVILPNDSDIEKGISVQDKILIEEEYFKKYPNIKPAGVRTLRKMISDIQAKKILEFIPEILVDIDTNIDSLKNSYDFLNNLLHNDHKKLSVNLRMMIEKLVGSSQERAEFENELKKRLDKEIRLCLESILVSKKTELIRSKNPINEGIVDIFKNKKGASVKDDFKDLFNYGIKSPLFVDNVNLSETYDNELTLGLTLSLVEPVINDNLGSKRTEWNKQLNALITKLLKDDNIHKIIKSVTSKLLAEYICNDSEFDDPISKKFAEYMIEEISSEAFESKIKYSITAMLQIERRPHVSLFEIMRYYVTKHPEIMKMPGFFLFKKPANRIKLEIYSQDWKEAYTNVLVNNMIENAFRNVNVNLLDRMIETLLIMTFDILNKDHAIKEQNKINLKITKLNEIKAILLGVENQ